MPTNLKLTALAAREMQVFQDCGPNVEFLDCGNFEI